MPVDPSHTEDEYFQKEEFDKLRRSRWEADAKLAATAREEAKKAHWMRCPKCGMELTEVAFRGVQVDKCFSCEGMFLDAGEAEKIVSFEEPGQMDKMFSFFVGKD